MNEDLQAADYRNHKVFLMPSRKIFLGRGRALSPEGRYLLGVMAAFLKEAPGGIVLSENGPREPGRRHGHSACHEPWPCSNYLVSLQNLDRQRFSVAAESIAPPEETDDSALAYHRDERMLEIVLLEGSVQR